MGGPWPVGAGGARGGLAGPQRPLPIGVIGRPQARPTQEPQPRRTPAIAMQMAHPQLCYWLWNGGPGLARGDYLPFASGKSHPQLAFGVRLGYHDDMLSITYDDESYSHRRWAGE